MLRRNLPLFQFAVIAAVMSAGSASLAAQPVPGSYELSFFNSALEPVSSLPVCTQSACEELVLNAHIEDSSGLPAQRGVAMFQYCSLKGLPPNDITRADEAPSAACETGSGSWANLAGLKVSESGNAYLNFGIVLIPRTVGFRFRYIGQGGVANGVSAPMDFTWVPAEP
jgi:hypothetical protein